MALLLVRVYVLGYGETRGRTYSKRNSSPLVSRVVFRKVIRSPVIGFSMMSPALATGAPSCSETFTSYEVCCVRRPGASPIWPILAAACALLAIMNVREHPYEVVWQITLRQLDHLQLDLRLLLAQRGAEAKLSADALHLERM